MKKKSGRKDSSSRKRLLSEQQAVDETIPVKGTGCCAPATKCFWPDVIHSAGSAQDIANCWVWGSSGIPPGTTPLKSSEYTLGSSWNLTAAKTTTTKKTRPANNLTATQQRWNFVVVVVWAGGEKAMQTTTPREHSCLWQRHLWGARIKRSGDKERHLLLLLPAAAACASAWCWHTFPGSSASQESQPWQSLFFHQQH